MYSDSSISSHLRDLEKVVTLSRREVLRLIVGGVLTFGLGVSSKKGHAAETQQLDVVLCALGIIQPASYLQLHEFLSLLFDDHHRSIPDKNSLSTILHNQAATGILIPVVQSPPPMFSLSSRANALLSVELRIARDKARLFLLRDPKRTKIYTPRVSSSKGGADDSSAEKFRTRIENSYWAVSFHAPREGNRWKKSKPIANVTFGPRGSTRGTYLPYLSFSSLEQIKIAKFSKSSGLSLTPEGLALSLGVSPRLIYGIVERPQHHYRTFELKKKMGGARRIESPRIFLKVIQRFLLDFILCDLTIHRHVHSFREGRSPLTNARNHEGKRFVAGIDIVDFFGSVTDKMVQALLKNHGFWEPTATLLSRLCTFNGRLPQGAPTSPLLSNAMLYPFDRQIAELCDSQSIVYSRYADDITLSGDDRSRIRSLTRTIGENLKARFNLRVNRKKSRFAGRGQQQRVTGIVVNATAAPPRIVRRQFRARLHRASLTPDVFGKEGESLRGYLSYLNSFPRFQKSVAIKKYCNVLNELRNKNLA